MMGWGIAIAVYVAMGAVYLVWLSGHRDGQGREQRRRNIRLAIMIPEVCLLWPFLLVLSLKHGGNGRHEAKG